MFPDGRGHPGMEAVVKTLVVSEIKAFLLQTPLHIPVDLRDETKSGMIFAHGGDGFRPERHIGGSNAATWNRALAPGFKEDVWFDQHRHVAADAIAQFGHAAELIDHGAAAFRVAIVELDSIPPSGEIRVAPESKDARAGGRFKATPVLRVASDVFLCS